MEEMIALVNRLLAQKPKDKNKLYSLHEPAVDCISKGKAHKRYEFGTKVSVGTTNRGGFVVGMRALPDGVQAAPAADRRPDALYRSSVEG
jgi:IS5 family transposase